MGVNGPDVGLIQFLEQPPIARPSRMTRTLFGLPLPHGSIRLAPSDRLDLAPVSAFARAVGRIAALADDRLKLALLGHA